MSPFVFSLSDPNANLITVGGKGIALARLARAGLPKPNSFQAITSTYRELVATNELEPQVLKLMQTIDAALPATPEAADSVQARLGTEQDDFGRSKGGMPCLR